MSAVYNKSEGMEKISAACAMEWSIELEKALRSNKPGRRIEAIKQIGHKLQQWSTEPSITVPVSDMYGMIPGEERVFANTILLRLADAFRYGDNCTRFCIVKVFILESKNLVKKGRRYNGILAKRRVPNYVELLKRVKVVYDTGNVEAKALALSLFGCWADLAKDSSQIRYMILSSLQSSNVSEVKASVIAAGYFCRLSEDFACIALEIFTNMISSLKTSSDVKLEAVRALSKMRCSSSVAISAYKAGKMLMRSLQQDELKAEMLSSLSKLAFHSSILTPEQVDVLLSTAIGESALLVKARALKCLYFLFRGGACCFPVDENVLATLINLIGNNELPLNSNCEALRILQKIFCSLLPDRSFVDMSGLFKLILILEKAAKSSSKDERCLALGLLVGIFCCMRRTMRRHWSSAPEEWHAAFFQFQRNSGESCDGDGPTLLVSHIASLIIDHMNSLVKHIIVKCGISLLELKQEFKSSLNLIMCLVEEYPSSAYVALDKLRCLIHTLVSVHGRYNIETSTIEKDSQIKLGAEGHKPALRPHAPDNKKEISIASELILCICQFTIACISILDETGSINSEIYCKVKTLVEFIQQSGSCSCDLYEIVCLNIRLYAISKCCEMTTNSSEYLGKSKLSSELGFSHNVHRAAQEWRALELIKNMLERRNYWEAYRTGKYSCCEGAWFAAAFTFRKLTDSVQSDLCQKWIKSLVFLAGGESEIRLLLFPKLGIEMINRMQSKSNFGRSFSYIEGEMSQYVDEDGDLCGCRGKFAKIYSRICSSEESLAAAVVPDGLYYFQRWFLTLRAKVLEIIVELLGLMDSHMLSEKLNEEGDDMIHFTTVLQTMHSLVSGFARISLRLNRLAKEYDLLAISFLDIDTTSFRSISRLALSCSVLAYCVAFAVSFLYSPPCKNDVFSSLDKTGETSSSIVIKDLIERFQDIDNTITTELQQFITAPKEAIMNLQPRTQINCSGIIDRDSLNVYKFVISRVQCIQEDSKGVKDEKGLNALFIRGLQLLSVIIRKWMEIPFSTPKYFFRVRPCIGAELFIFNAGSKSTNALSISAGLQLSLSLCIQLKNASKESRVQVAKIYCILAVMPSDGVGDRERERRAQWPFQARKLDEMVELNEILRRHIRTDSDIGCSRHSEVDAGCGFVTSCVCFEPNGKGQGFSTCLVDVSALSEGSYLIKWHSCCIDKRGFCWSLLPMSPCSVLAIKKS